MPCVFGCGHFGWSGMGWVVKKIPDDIPPPSNFVNVQSKPVNFQMTVNNDVQISAVVPRGTFSRKLTASARCACVSEV